MTDTDWEDYYLNSIDEFDSVAFDRDPKPLPCWCRGVEVVPLEELPLFHYLKARRDDLDDELSSPIGLQIQGLGRGRARNGTVMPAKVNEQSSDEDDIRDYVGRYWRRQEPMEFAMQTQQQDNKAVVPHVSRPHTVQPFHVQIPCKDDEKRSCEVQSSAAPCPVQRNPLCAGVTQSNGPSTSGAKRKFQKRPNERKGSFNPQEYSDNFSLNHWVQTHALKGSSHAEESDDDDGDSVFNGGRHTPISSSSTALSSTEDSTAEQASVHVPRRWRVLEVGNLPESVSTHELGELLADFGIVEHLSISENNPWCRVAVVRMTNEADLDWIQECLLTSYPFGTSSMPLTVKILEPEV